MCYKCCRAFDTKVMRLRILNTRYHSKQYIFSKHPAMNIFSDVHFGETGHELFLCPIIRQYGALVNITFSVVMLVLCNKPAFLSVRMHMEIL